MYPRRKSGKDKPPKFGVLLHQRGPDTLPFTGRKDSAEATLSIGDALCCFSIRSLVAAQSRDKSREMIQQMVTGRYSNFLNTDFIL